MSNEPPTPDPPVEAPTLNAPTKPLPGEAGTASTEGVEAALKSTAEVRPSNDSWQDDKAKQDFLWRAHGYVNEYTRFADSKAGFAGTLAGALLAALYGAGNYLPLLATPYQEWPVSAWLTILAGVFLVLSVSIAIWTVVPRLGSSQSKGFVFWNSVAAHGTVEQFQTAFAAQSTRTLNKHLLHHLFDISSKVTIPKYRAVSLCIWCLCIGGILATLALIAEDAPSVQTPTAITQEAPRAATGASVIKYWRRGLKL